MAEIVCEDKTTREINRKLKGLIAQGRRIFLSKARCKAQPGRGGPGVRAHQVRRQRWLLLRGYDRRRHGGGRGERRVGSGRVHDGWGWWSTGSTGNGTVGRRFGAAPLLFTAMQRPAGGCDEGRADCCGGQLRIMAGFMGQKGTLIVCGDTGAALGDSMYETVCFCGRQYRRVGKRRGCRRTTEADLAFLEKTLSQHLPEKAGQMDGRRFKKVVSGRKLWNFDKDERAVWREAL